jgi:hypothetical protein
VSCGSRHTAALFGTQDKNISFLIIRFYKKMARHIFGDLVEMGN